MKIKKVSDSEEYVPPDSLLKKNVNIFLMILLMLGMLVGIAYVVVYQERLGDINYGAEETTANLSSCSEELTLVKNSLGEATNRLNQTEKDVKTYDTIYEQKESELETAKDVLDNTLDELQTTKVRLQSAEVQAAQDKAKADELQIKYDDALVAMDALAKDVSFYKKKINCLLVKEGEEEDDC